MHLYCHALLTPTEIDSDREPVLIEIKVVNLFDGLTQVLAIAGFTQRFGNF